MHFVLFDEEITDTHRWPGTAVKAARHKAIKFLKIQSTAAGVCDLLEFAGGVLLQCLKGEAW